MFDRDQKALTLQPHHGKKTPLRSGTVPNGQSGLPQTGQEALIEVPAPTECNIEAAAKFALRLVDHWTRWEQSALKLADKTCHPDTWRKVENLKPKVEDFTQQATDLAKWHEKRKQSKEVNKTHPSEMIVESCYDVRVRMSFDGEIPIWIPDFPFIVMMKWLVLNINCVPDPFFPWSIFH